MPALKYAKPERLDLKSHPEFTEKWLQDRIAEDATILGLGELTVLARERRQVRAGRLDLLLKDEEDCRYEVELMLGATDESHIIRAIEYWDIERRKYPAYDHVAVLVAEDITSRFLNVLSLFAGSIPLLALQLTALKVGDQVVLNFAKVVDQRQLREDDETETEGGGQTDRAYWVNKASKQSLEVADAIEGLVRAACSDGLKLNYNKHHVGFTDGTRSRNFIVCHPRKKHVPLGVRISKGAEWVDRLGDAGITASKGKYRLNFPLNAESVKEHAKLLSELFAQAWKEEES